MLDAPPPRSISPVEETIVEAVVILSATAARAEGPAALQARAAAAHNVVAPSAEQKAEAEELRRQADTHYNQGQYEQSLADYGKAIELNPTYAVAYNRRG